MHGDNVASRRAISRQFLHLLPLGHGLGLFADVIVGILGAFLGGLLAALLHIKVQVVGYSIIVAFAGPVLLRFIVRLVSGGGSRRRRTT